KRAPIGYKQMRAQIRCRQVWHVLRIARITQMRVLLWGGRARHVNSVLATFWAINQRAWLIMSCLDVMYPTYGHYAPYAHKASAFISTLPAPVGVRSVSSSCREPMDSTGAHCCSAAPSTPPYPSSGQLDEGSKNKEVREAEYLSSRCVLFTYYQGDISSVVDEHFSRALSTYMEAEGKKKHSDPGSAISLDPTLSMTSPSSFPDTACLPTDTMFIRSGQRSGSSCNYPSPPSRPHCEPTGAPTYAVDPYSTALHPGLAHSHPHPHPSDSWNFSQSQPYATPRPLHELYTPPGLDSHYGALLMPAVRPPHLPTLPGHYDVGKLEASAAWPGLLPPGDMAQSLALNMEPGLQHHKKGKELYWF
ncbi:hypothetical protein DNTS_026695, partial [Danionella cerebrum]